MKKEVVLAWGVHAFTASGIIPAFFAIVFLSQENFLWAFIMLMITHFIDGVDGTLARRARVTEVLPQMSGKMMDCIIDFATYAIIPIFAMYMAQGFWPDVSYVREGCLMLALLVSTLYYGKEGMVSSDYYFVGFPVLWNWVAFYLYYVFGLSPWLNVTVICVCSVLHFVPIKYVYPSRSKELFIFNLVVFFTLVFSNIFVMLIKEGVMQGEGFLLVSRLVAMLTLLYLVVFGFYISWKKKGQDPALSES